MTVFVTDIPECASSLPTLLATVAPCGLRLRGNNSEPLTCYRHRNGEKEPKFGMTA